MKRLVSVATRYAIALSRRQIPLRGHLDRILLLLLRGPASASLHLVRESLLRFPGAWLIDLPHRDEALPFEGLHPQAAFGCGPADGSSQAVLACRP